MKQNRPNDKAQIVYFSHGVGPLPILGDASHASMVDFMRQLPSRLRKPDAILVISAHWEESTATLLGAHAPPMFYDYYGFPDKAYEMGAQRLKEIKTGSGFGGTPEIGLTIEEILNRPPKS